VKALVLGGEGMLGHKMYQTLLAGYPDTACTIFGRLSDPFYGRIGLFKTGRVIENVDAMDLPALRRTLEGLRPEFIVNCIGIIRQRKEAEAHIPSITLNSLLPHLLADWASAWSGRVIHFSTDCVFSGRRGDYTEDDLPDAEDLYGKSKYLGEVAVANALTLRTSIIGRELAFFKSLLEWFLSQTGGEIRGYRKVIYSGVTTNYISDLVGRIIEEYPALSGLYQVTSPKISKHDLLCMIRDAYGLNIRIVPYDDEVSDRSMIGEKFLAATGYRQPTWPELVDQLVNDSTPYSDWR
jgi:dTDP-4-dehydrorhamnose reductase